MRSARILAILLSCALVGAACGGGDDGVAAGDDASGSPVGSAPASVWPLPPDGEVLVVAPYTQGDDGATFHATATFDIGGIGIDDAVAFYQAYFAENGVTANVFSAGQFTALDLTYPADPNVVAVVEITETATGVTIRQEKSAMSGSDAANTPSSETVAAAPTPTADGDQAVPTSTPDSGTPDGDDTAGSGGDMGDGEDSGNGEMADGGMSDSDDMGDGDDTDDGGDTADSGGGTAMIMDGGVATIDWSAANPTYLPAAAGATDPFFHIHSSNEIDGFYLSFEMYTVWGEAWTGETGTFDISCQNPRTDTGICVHFDPDGAGPSPDLGEDFGARGKVVIRRLDAGGYDFDVTGLTFSDGTFFNDFTMQG